MARPHSVPDFSQYLAHIQTSPTRHRKKPSISLAAGLIMAGESPKTATPSSPNAKAGALAVESNLFYAYAQKADSPHTPPYVLTFANASVADRWWEIVKQEYPACWRPSPQLFILKSDDISGQIQDNPRLGNLRNQWFYTSTANAGGTIPVQDERGRVAAGLASAQSGSSEEKTATPSGSDAPALSAKLDKMQAMIEANADQIKALTVAQSAGLQRMQEINESNAGQIKALADSQDRLQAFVERDAAHYIALSNLEHAAQQHLKGVLEESARHIGVLAEGQERLMATCAEMAKTVSQVAASPGATRPEASTRPPSTMEIRIVPAPRKLNRRVRGVWYEYDTLPSGMSGKTALNTPPRSPPGSRA